MKKITTNTAPPSIGLFTQGIHDGDQIYVSGQGPVHPDSGEIIDGTIEDQTARILENVDAVLQAAGRSLDDVVKATIFVQNMGDYDAINDVYAEYMGKPYPTRSAVQVENLPMNIDVEIEVVASAREE
jgi:2-iminobutanoate/2-iminopropanoate deaminase